MNKKIPAVSIIIPMHNVEKYIGACLGSISVQTFKDYEVIVVDDCSTDNSVKIAESYLPKFNQADGDSDKLKIVRLNKNSGAPGIPCNKGLSFSRGEYIIFIESDDMITKTALKELYPIAKRFDADVVQCERFYLISENDEPLTIAGLNAGEFVTEPTLISDNFQDRAIGLSEYQFVLNVWTKLIRRDYIMDNNLQMIDANAHDAVYTACLVCSAKRYVRVPNIVNFYRVVENSMSHIKQDVTKTIRSRIRSLTRGFDYLDKFLSEREFFQKRPDLKYLVLEVWIWDSCQYLQEIYEQIPAWQFDAQLRKEFEGSENKTALMAFLFSRMNFLNLNFSSQKAMTQQQHNEK